MRRTSRNRRPCRLQQGRWADSPPALSGGYAVYYVGKNVRRRLINRLLLSHDEFGWVAP